jgi:hypothetical protein
LRSHSGPTNPKSNPKRSRSESETQRTKGLAAQHRTKRTVREHWADRPRGLGGPSENNPRTSSTTPSITDRPRWAANCPPRHGPSSTLVRTVCELRATKIHRQKGSNKKHARTREEHDELLAESHLADRPPGARRSSAWSADSNRNPTS